MKLDTITKVTNKKNNTINLRQESSASRILKVKGNNDVLFYSLLIVMMVIVVTFWGIHLKKTWVTPGLRNEEGEEIFAKYNLKDSIIDFKELIGNSFIDEETEDHQKKIQEINNIIDSMSEDQKEKLRENIEQKSIPDEFHKEELEVRLEMLQNNK